MKAFAVVMLGISVMLVCGCKAAYKGTFLAADHAFRFIPCPSSDIENPQEQAFDALVAALADENWVIEGSNKKTLRLIARICKQSGGGGDPLKKPDGKCVAVHFSVQEDASILAYNPQSKRMRDTIALDAHAWMNELDRAYAELRCYSAEKLQERNAAKPR